MRVSILAVLAVLVLIPVSAIAQNEFHCKSDKDCMGFEHCDEGSCEYYMADWRKGLELEVRGGLSMCVPFDDGCNGLLDEIKIGGGGGIFAGIRPTSNFSAGIDFGYFAFGHEYLNNDESSLALAEGEDSNYDSLIRFLNVMAEVRGYVPYGYKGSGFGDIFFKVGVGYMSLKEDYSAVLSEPASEYPDKLHSPFSLKLGLGLTFYFLQDSAKGDIGMGINAEYLFFFAKGDMDCTRYYNENSGASSLRCNEIDGFHSRMHTMQFSAHLKWVMPLF